jgi:hypothetical protein
MIREFLLFILGISHKNTTITTILSLCSSMALHFSLRKEAKMKRIRIPRNNE